MRIISGKYRGMNLAEFKGENIRPTADRVKESLFNILAGKIVGARVLDLFCGSGNLGIESISRGADFVHFNDISKDSISLLKKNLSRLKDNNFSVTVQDYSLCLSRVKGFDLIFIDPPYAKDFGNGALKIIGENNLLNQNGIAVLERDRSFTGEIAGLGVYDERKYGRVYLTFFRGVKI